VACCCEHSNEPSGSIKGGEFSTSLSQFNYQLVPILCRLELSGLTVFKFELHIF